MSTTVGASCKTQQVATVLVRNTADMSWQSHFQGQSLHEGTQLGCNASLAHLEFGVTGDRTWVPGVPACIWEWLRMGMFLHGHSASLSSEFYSAANLLMVLVCKPSIICFLPAQPDQQGKQEQGFPFSPTAGKPTVSAA